MDTTLLFILSVLATCAFVLGVVVLFILGTGLVIRNLWARRQPYTASEMARAEAESSDFLSGAAAGLLPWSPDAMADLSDHWEGTRGATSAWLVERHQGVVQSLGQPGGPGRLAFFLSLKGGRGFLRLLTPEREVRLDIAPGVVHVSSRSRQLGSMALSTTTQTFLDAAGQAVGRYHRFKGSLVRADYGPVELGGRTLAEATILVRHRDALLDRPPQAALRKLAAALSPEEEDWLLAVVGLELVYNASRYRLRGHSL